LTFWIIALFIALSEAMASVAAIETDGTTRVVFAVFSVSFPFVVFDAIDTGSVTIDPITPGEGRNPGSRSGGPRHDSRRPPRLGVLLDSPSVDAYTFRRGRISPLGS
jgi:hypothetical protein